MDFDSRVRGYEFQMEQMGEEGKHKHLVKMFSDAFDLGAETQANATTEAIIQSRRAKYTKIVDEAREAMARRNFKHQPSEVVKLLRYVLNDAWIGGLYGENTNKELLHENLLQDLELAISKSNLGERIHNYL